MTRQFSFLLVPAMISLVIMACGKDNDEPAMPPPTNPPVVTLPAGWSVVDINKTLYDVFFVNEKIGFVSGNNYLAKSTDGGASWADIKISADSLRLINIFFVDPLSGWVLGEKLGSGKSFLFRTIDGGLNWIRHDLTKYFTDIQFLSNKQGYAIGGKSLFLSSDSGKTWNATPGKISESAQALFFLDSTTGWVAGDSKISITKDGGKTFSVQFAQFEGFPTGMQFIDANYGWVPAVNGIFRTENGGNTWELSPMPKEALDVHFINRNEGFILHKGSIAKSIDGGKSFTNVFHSGQSFIELHFYGTKHGWAVNYDGDIFCYVQP